MQLFPLSLNEPITCLHVPPPSTTTTTPVLFFIGLASGATYCFISHSQSTSGEWLCLLLGKRSDEQVSHIWYVESTKQVFVVVGDAGVKRYQLNNLTSAIPIVAGCNHDQFKPAVHPIAQCVGTTVLAHDQVILIVRPRPASREVIITNFAQLEDDYPTSRSFSNVGPGSPENRIFGKAFACDFDGTRILWVSKEKGDSYWLFTIWDVNNDCTAQTWKMPQRFTRDYPGQYIFFTPTMVLGPSSHTTKSLSYWDLTSPKPTEMIALSTSETILAFSSSPASSFVDIDNGKHVIIMTRSLVAVFLYKYSKFSLVSSCALAPVAAIELRMPNFVALLQTNMALYSDDVGVHLVSLR